MGLPMASNLIRAGYRLAVCDRAPAAVAALAAQGARACATPREVSELPGVAAIVTMLPSTEAVRQVYCGADGLLAARRGLRAAVLIDSSTVYPGAAAEVAAAVAAAPLHEQGAAASGGGPAGFVDAPVSGGVPGAQAATLTFMVRSARRGCAPALRPPAWARPGQAKPCGLQHRALLVPPTPCAPTRAVRRQPGGAAARGALPAGHGPPRRALRPRQRRAGGQAVQQPGAWCGPLLGC